MISYDPKDAVLCWPEGEYQATLNAVEETTSKAGNDMYVLTFDVHNGDATMTMKEYAAVPAFVWKLKRLAQALGVSDAFEAGKFSPEEFIGHNVQIWVKIERREGFDDRNIIEKYFPKADKSDEVLAPKDKKDEKRHPLNIEDDADLPF